MYIPKINASPITAYLNYEEGGGGGGALIVSKVEMTTFLQSSLTFFKKTASC